jgi:hypothetical protein
MIGVFTTTKGSLGVIDWCNENDKLDLLEDIDPCVFNINKFPRLELGDLIEVEYSEDYQFDFSYFGKKLKIKKINDSEIR